MPHYLFILRQPPHQNRRVLETLDVVLTTAAFEQSVTLLFLDEGVWQLKTNQKLEGTGLSDSAAWLKALPLYGVSELWVETESLQQRGLSEQDMILPVHLINRTELNHFLQQQTIIVCD